MDKQIILERKQGKNGKFHYLTLTEDRKRGYYVYDQESIDKFCALKSSEKMWPVCDGQPWATFDSSHHRQDMEPVEPEQVMTSSYEEVCNYLKVNVLIGVV